ncbi:TonB-dependent receptor [Reichenbachiella ulvae]|uniref:TonB-dependent receptor n=1 Tax=Reichenbachiella ulvae TaxID=2980104 RepID=A0ABT3CZA8_9BACT|nr:TonB-dependent receptor [Reichenbachiella ulvae]MCV9388906.1 TonB-dependent receptor [Reichenbachiella ulvae]
MTISGFLRRFTYLLIFLLCLSVQEAYSQYTVSGFVVDSLNNQALPSAWLGNERQGHVSTNDYGYFSINSPEGELNLTVSFLGYKKKKISLHVESNMTLNIKMSPHSNELKEVVVIGASSNFGKNSLESNIINIEQIKQMPYMFGEVDLIKSIQFQPGVKTIGEGTSSMYIRGGSSDQNLIMINDMPLYNISHMMGLVSVFNPDAIQSIRFYKSAAPANYAGRISGILDVRQHEGNFNFHEIKGGLSLLGLRASAQGPLIKGAKTAYFLSTRASWINWFVEPEQEFIPGYVDINIGLTHIIDEKSRIQLYSYAGRDWVESDMGFDNQWGNTAVNLKYQRVLKPKLFSDFSLIGSSYSNTYQTEDSIRHVFWKTGVSDLSFKANVEYSHTNSNSISVGLASTIHDFTPGESQSKNTSIPSSNAVELGTYIQCQWAWLDRYFVSAGLHWSCFANYGQATWYDSSNGRVRENERGIYHYNNYLQPRLSVSMKMGKKNLVSARCGRMAQNVMVLDNSQLGYTSLESWFPSNPNIKPMVANNFSVSWGHTLLERFTLELASYYKRVENQPDFVDKAQLIGNPNAELEIRQGSSISYGIETSISKEVGILFGDISYTWSRSINHIPSLQSEKYPSNFDMPHEIKVNLGLKASSSWQFSLYWIYSTGRPFTPPVSYMIIEGRGIPVYAEKNTGRFPNYHRLDVSAKWLPKSKDERFRQSIALSVYNLYARSNPMSYNFTFTGFYGQEPQPSISQYAMTSFFPNITYEFSF